jgi:DNA polymerase elongation subunit (family B)
MIDKDIKTGIQVPETDDEYVDINDVKSKEVDGDWRIHYLDIEAEDRNGFPEDGDEPILCITSYDTHSDEYNIWLVTSDDHSSIPDTPHSELHSSSVNLRVFEQEDLMLDNYLTYLEDTKPAVYAGWNVDDFDIQYLIDRLDTLNERSTKEIPSDRLSPQSSAGYNNFGASIQGVVVFDLLKAFKRRQRGTLDSYSLDNVAEEFVGEEKEKYVGTIGSLWEDDPNSLLDYNLRDVELLVELDRRQDILQFAKEVKGFAGCQLGDAPIESSVCDIYLLNKLHGDRVLPRQSSQESESFKGADVFDPINGLKEMVSVLDLASLYPMSMLTLNASPETKVDPETYDGETLVSPNGIHFRKDKEGITRDIILELLDERNKKKEQRDRFEPDEEMYNVYDIQQTAIKVVMNALYGMLAWDRFRLYDVDVASAITATGRGVLQHTARMVEHIGYEVLYGDTDSVMLGGLDPSKEKDTLIAESFNIEEAINSSYDGYARDKLNAEEHYFEIEFEKLYSRYFQAGRKKRYAGHVIWKEGKHVDSTDVIGFEYKRADTSEFASVSQKKMLDMLVEGEESEVIIDYVADRLDLLKMRDVSLSEIGLPEGIGKTLTNYKADTHNARGAKIGNLLTNSVSMSGDRPRRYYIKNVHTDFFERMEDEEGFDPQRDRMYASFKDEPWVISVKEPGHLPPEVEIDWEKMTQKNLKEVTDSIVSSLGFGWGDVKERAETGEY